MSDLPGMKYPAWRGLIEHYREYLPITDDTPVITLHEGGTPLLPAPRLSIPSCGSLLSLPPASIRQ